MVEVLIEEMFGSDWTDR